MTFLCEIKLWPAEFEPEGWTFCDGRELSIQKNQALYSIIGNRFGGDGIRTFNLPDLRSKIPVGAHEKKGNRYQVGKITPIGSPTSDATQTTTNGMLLNYIMCTEGGDYPPQKEDY